MDGYIKDIIAQNKQQLLQKDKEIAELRNMIQQGDKEVTHLCNENEIE